ncbi:MAG: type II toxin-antitoxin system VapC family toxin [Solirubrobacteraceae bacterium]
MPHYLDTSAFIKLVRTEPESPALLADLGGGPDLVSSALLVVEGRRAAARYGTVAEARARAALSTITLLPIDNTILEHAASLPPPVLRSLDALHLATATSLGDDSGHFYCYDVRLGSAAAMLGLDVRQPA